MGSTILISSINILAGHFLFKCGYWDDVFLWGVFYGIYRYNIADYHPYEPKLYKLLLTPLLIAALYGGVLNILTILSLQTLRLF